jgi:hypothetical protein
LNGSSAEESRDGREEEFLIYSDSEQQLVSKKESKHLERIFTDPASTSKIATLVDRQPWRHY